MTPLVVDSSVLVTAVTDDTGHGEQALRRMEGRVLHAPHLVDAELGAALRRMVLRRQIAASDANASRRLGESLIQVRHAHHGSLTEAAWRLRNSVGFYDGLYVALSAALGCELLTTDARLGRAAQSDAEVHVL